MYRLCLGRVYIPQSDTGFVDDRGGNTIDIVMIHEKLEASIDKTIFHSSHYWLLIDDSSLSVPRCDSRHCRKEMFAPEGLNFYSSSQHK